MTRAGAWPRGAAEVAAVVALCSAFVLSAQFHARSTSATYDEPSHLAAGYSYWRWNDYRMNPEHPPLVKLLASLPLLRLAPWPADFDPTHDAPPVGESSSSLRRAKKAWEQALTTSDAQWVFGHTLLYGMTDSALAHYGVSESYEVDPTLAVERQDYVSDANLLLLWARWPVILMGLALALLIFCWARELYGPTGALIALALYCLDPNFIGHSSLVTTDVGAALFFCGTLYFLWRTFREPGIRNVMAFALCFGLAAVTKFSAVLLVPMVVLAGLAAPRARPGGSVRARCLFLVGLIGAAGVTAYGTIWASYGFRFAAAAQSEQRLPTEQVLRRAAATRALAERYPDTAPPAEEMRSAMAAAHFSLLEGAVLTASRLELLPEAYLHGLAHSRSKSLARFSFLRGKHRAHGAWNYFLWTFALKTPLVTLTLCAGAALFAFYRRPSWRAEWVFLLAPVLICFLASMSSALNIGHRHLLAAYPFLFVFCGSLALDLDTLRRSATRRGVIAAVVAATIVSSSVVFSPPWRPVRVYPNYLAFFNEIAHGPREGYRHLVDSNLDWGQDLVALKSWLDEREITDPINLCYFGMADPRFHGIRHVKMPGGYPLEPPFEGRARFEDARVPGYLAISATHLQGVYLGPELRSRWHALLQRARPLGTAGHSIFIYSVEAVAP